MQQYARDFFSGVLLQVLAVVALIEAIFLAERFTIVFRDAAAKDANLLDIFLMLGCTSTEIFDLALSVAVLIAVYSTVLRMRENRELLALFAAGSGPLHLTVLALVIAVASQVVSLSVSGLLDPASRYAQRVLLLDAEMRALKTGISTGQFYFFPNYVAFAPEQSGLEQGLFAPNESYLAAGHAIVPHKRAAKRNNRRLFLYEQAGPTTSRIITADRARLDGPDPAGNVTLHLSGFTQHMFNDREAPESSEPLKPLCHGCPDTQDIPQIAMSVGDMTQVMHVSKLLPFPPRGSDPREQTIIEEVLQRPNAGSSAYQPEMETLGDRMARSLLCLLAPLIALFAVSYTNRFTSYIALPIACLALMAFNIAGEWFVRVLAPTNPAQAVTLPLFVTLGTVAGFAALITVNQSALIRPGFARS
jgi:lipopolysaccharide export LptBFGC system permease protein LptF